MLKCCCNGPQYVGSCINNSQPEIRISIPVVVSYREVSVDRHTATRTQTLKKGREGRTAGREPTEKYEKPRGPTENQGPCPDLMGTCIKAFTVAARRVRREWRHNAGSKPVREGNLLRRLWLTATHGGRQFPSE